MSRMTPYTSQHAVMHVSNKEKDKPQSQTYTKSNKDNFIDWSEFGRMILSWFVSGFVIFVILLILTMADKSTDLWKDTILRIDTISLFFSLVLSATLEQVWNNKKQIKYKITQIGELILSTLGLIMYLTYSLWNIYDPCNPYFTNQFAINLIYIIISTVFVIIGFLIRAIVEKEET